MPVMFGGWRRKNSSKELTLVEERKVFTDFSPIYSINLVFPNPSSLLLLLILGFVAVCFVLGFPWKFYTISMVCSED